MVMTPTGWHVQFGGAPIPLLPEEAAWEFSRPLPQFGCDLLPEEAAMEKFWVVIGSRNTVSARHASPHLAAREAERLCRETQKPFVVAEAVAACEPSAAPVRWTTLKRPS
jgi:hypothetical protein